MPEGYQPSPAELGLAQEVLEANGIREEETDHGFRHLDAEGRMVVQTETHGDTQQTIQFTYGEAEAMTEQGKLLTGPEEGKVLQREHPWTAIQFDSRFEDPDLGLIEASVDAKVETLAGTVSDSGELTERWANLETANTAWLEKFSTLPEARRMPGENGETYGIFRGEFGGGFEIDVDGRTILIESIKKLSVTYNVTGQPIRANFGTIAWHEAKPDGVE